MQRLESVGRFDGHITEQAIEKSSQKGTPCIRLRLRVDESDQDCAGQEIDWYGWLSDAAMEITVKALTEIAPDFNGDLMAIHDGSFSLVGMPCNFTTKEEADDKDVARTRVQFLNGPGGGGTATVPLEQAEIGNLIAGLSRKCQAFVKDRKGGMTAARPAAQPKSSRPAARPANATATAEDDDQADKLPF